MTRISLDEITVFVEQNIGPKFHDKKIDKIKKLSLNDIVKRKNPYLFKAKACTTANDFVSAVVGATASSGEETTFGDFLEQLAIFICSRACNGRKSSTKGIDLEFEDGQDKYLISIKSGPNWGNSSQIEKLADHFKTAKKTLSTSGAGQKVNFICIEGCCYGVDASPNKGTHLKLCGEEFWKLISGGDSNLYRTIIVPLGHRAEEQKIEVDRIYTAKINQLTGEFIARFCDKTGAVDWDKLIRFNSGRNRP